jgi:GTP pyrophosphokinase
MLSIGIPKLEGRLDERFNTVLTRIERYAPVYNRDMLERAYAFASQIHDGQLRRSGEPYIIHPLEVAHVLAELEMDESTIAAALLHDTIEDGLLERPDGTITPVTRADITQRFGAEIATLVEGVTKLGTVHFHSHEVRQAENLRKMLLATARDVRVILIKLADRFHNMRTLKFMPEADQKRIADETLRIFAPIAHRLGIWKIKWELEDLSLRALEPEVYRDIQTKVNRTRAEREDVVSTAIGQLSERMAQVCPK